LDSAQAAARAEVPVGRLGTVEELAAAAVFLCSAQAAYITGTSVLVDGGVTRSVS
jgi:3-oxoacyl-[acyl-carrier protein] reductase